jgi:hypothetical protein
VFNIIDKSLNIIHIARMKWLPTLCPSCGGTLAVKRLHCDKCETEVEGLYPLSPLAGLGQDDQDFIVDFIKASGSLKDMATLLGVSYPTVRNRLDGVIEKLRQRDSRTKEKK